MGSSVGFFLPTYNFVEMGNRETVELNLPSLETKVAVGHLMIFPLLLKLVVDLTDLIHIIMGSNPEDIYQTSQNYRSNDHENYCTKLLNIHANL